MENGNVIVSSKTQRKELEEEGKTKEKPSLESNNIYWKLEIVDILQRMSKRR